MSRLKTTQSMFETAMSPFLPFLPATVLAKPDVVTTDYEKELLLKFCHQGLRFHLYLELGWESHTALKNPLHPPRIQTTYQGFHKCHLFPRILHYRQWILKSIVHYWLRLSNKMIYQGTLEGHRMKFGAKTIERLEASIFVTETTSWAVNICKNLIRDVSVPQHVKNGKKY